MAVTPQNGDIITVQIQDVDLANRIIHVKDRLGGAYQITFRATGAFLQIPVVNEHWTATRVGFQWHLGSRINDPDEVTNIDELGQGDIRIQTTGDIHLNPGGSVDVMGMVVADGLATMVSGTAPSDDDFPGGAVDGLIVVDEGSDRLYVRVGGVWKYTTLT